ncbi:MAG: 4Fe-4S dicluster domain-containing protein [Desulfobacula sp.]|nr:4Fe-4S dicluster domain-containing protein [Desulfobacula sp.]
MFYPALYTSLLLAAAGFLFQIFRLNKTNKSWQRQKGFKFNFTPAFLNTIFQTKLFRASKTRWVIHFLVFSGFFYLLIFHALADLTSIKWFQYYQSTVDPYQFLRNLTGFMVAVGCLGFLLKKIFNMGATRNIKGRYQNLFSILLIFSLIFSGFMLEAVKIISEPLFMEMVEDYAGIDEDSGLDELKVYWEKNYSVVFQETLLSSEESLEEGKILNEDYCLDCHSNIASAFVSKPLAGYLKKTAQSLNDFRADNLLYHIHYLLSFLMLICLPFTGLFHILLIPFASLKQKSDIKEFQKQKAGFNPVTLDACTDCRLCSEVCSVYPNFVITENIKVLPHSKIRSSRKMMLDKHLDLEELSLLHIANQECTLCNNCTDICPSGIDLQALWVTLSKTLNNMDLATIPALENIQFNKVYDIIPSTESFDNCVQCTICTNVCPIVEYSSDDENDMNPQQIMNLLRLGKKQMAAQTKMVQNCLTCYACQESCPGEIKVTDIMIELRQAVTKC